MKKEFNLIVEKRKGEFGEFYQFVFQTDEGVKIYLKPLNNQFAKYILAAEFRKDEEE